MSIEFIFILIFRSNTAAISWSVSSPSQNGVDINGKLKELRMRPKHQLDEEDRDKE